MTFWQKLAFVVSVLVVLDGLVCLFFRRQISSIIRSYLPGADIIKIALIEIAAGLSIIAFLLWYVY